MSALSHTNLRRTLLLTSLAAALFSAQAGTVRYYAEGQVPSPAVVAGILGKGQPVKRMKMRGGGAPLDEPVAQVAADGGREMSDDPMQRELALSASAHAAVRAWRARVGDPAAVPAPAPSTRYVRAAAAEAAPAAPAPAQGAQSLALAISFDNDSARLRAAAAQSLDAVAEGMRMVGFARAFVIEGHASATGSSAHNQRLSQARAASVKRYLVQHHGIPASALRTIGLGESVPLNPNDPDAAENRRVQFRAA
jgi:outer membrane protein OmpA-like peptidoglycan-associated protein